MAEWRELSQTLTDPGIKQLYLRLILVIYANHKCNVRWCSKLSQSVDVQNGVRQEILLAVYINKLLKILLKLKLGCNIYCVFFNALIFAVDIILLSASHSQYLLRFCVYKKFEVWYKQRSFKVQHKILNFHQARRLKKLS